MAKNSVRARIRDAITGEEFSTFGLSDGLGEGGYVLVDAGVRPDVYIQRPVIGMEDQQPEPVQAARFVDPPTSIEVGVATAFVPELFTDLAGTAESYADHPERWTFQASAGSFAGNLLTTSAAGLVVVSASYDDGAGTQLETPPLTITAFVDVEVPPETSVAEVDFSVEANGTTLDEITTASAHTFVVKNNPGATAEVQGGRLIATNGFVEARAVGVAPPAEYDIVFVIAVASYESTRMQAGVTARFNDGFTAGYFFFFSARDDERVFVLDSTSGHLGEVSHDLPIGQHQCRARIRNAYKALDLMVAGAWQQLIRVEDNQFVGGMPGVYASGANTPATGVGLISAEATAPSADPEIDVSVEISGVPAQSVEETDYQIHSQLVQIGGGVVSDSIDSPEDWEHAVTVGAGQATIGGPNDDVFQVGPLV